MKSPKKPIKKVADKNNFAVNPDSVRKTKLKPLSPKESKNWKNKLDDEEEDDFPNRIEEDDDDLEIDDIDNELNNDPEDEDDRY